MSALRTWSKDFPGLGDHRGIPVEVKRPATGDIALAEWNGSEWVKSGTAMDGGGKPLGFEPELFRLPATTFADLCDEVRQTQAFLNLVDARFLTAVDERDAASSEMQFARRQLARFVERETAVE